MIGDYYKQTVSILTCASSVNSIGTAVKTYATSVSVAGLLCPSSGRDQFSQGKETVFATHRLYIASTSTITEKCRVSVDARTYNVLHVRNVNSLGHHLQVYLEEIR
jgi:SPP1 family predicted phage head-tail adaptor